MNFATLIAHKASAIIFVLLMVNLPVSWAGNIHNVTIVQRESLTEGSFDLRLTVSLGTQQQILLLNESAVFSDLNIIQSSPLDTEAPGPTAAQKAIKTYQGIIEDLPDSWVRLTLESDHLSGVIDSGTERYYITSESPQRASNPPRRILRALHAVDKPLHPPPEELSERNRMIRDVIEINVNNDFSTQPDRVTRVARIALVIDTLYDEALAGRGLAQAIATINAVDGIYQQEFGLALKVDTAIIITDTTTLDLGSASLEENLARFRVYRQSALELDANLGMVHLFTGVRTTDPSVGLAYIGAACRTDGYDISMSTPFDFPVLLTAHEIGHNLGALHDDETELCHLTTNQLMFSHISSLTTNEFSSCTVDAINKRLAQSSCHLDAIDLSLTLSRQGDTGIVALITNTDTQRAFPSALFTLKLKNASIAAAPASCNINSTTEVQCTIPTTYPGESQSVPIDVRLDGALESTLDASLGAIDFIDVNTMNNHAQIVIPVPPDTNPPITIANNDGSPATGSADPVNDSNANSAGSGGGSINTIGLLMLLFAVNGICNVQRKRFTHYRQRQN